MTIRSVIVMVPSLVDRELVCRRKEQEVQVSRDPMGLGGHDSVSVSPPERTSQYDVSSHNMITICVARPFFI